ncbi:MAG: HAMP domain-containing sensor histidine kinase [Acidobacteriota bacterium]
MPIIRVMNIRERGTTSMLIVLAVLLLLLPLLAILQYRWQSQLSEREREHMTGNLRASAFRFGQDLDDELTRAYVIFAPSMAVGKEAGLSAFATRYDRWLTQAQYPQLVRDVFVAQVDEQEQFHLYQLNPESKQFSAAQSWPAELSKLAEQLAHYTKDEQRTFLRELMGRRFQLVNEQLAVLVHPILIPPTFRERGQVTWSLPIGFVIVTLNLDEIKQDILPTLAKRHFLGTNGFDYSATIVTNQQEQKTVFQFGPESASKTAADVKVGLLGLRRETIRRIISSLPPAEREQMNLFRPPPPNEANPNSTPPPAPREIAPMAMGNDEQKLWELRLTHRAGSLEAAVTAVRRRNLLISFGILLVLAASVALMMQSAQRAHRLARQQMDFVAGVSHELRTPLAVIKSAAWSLTRGVIREEEQIKRYSTLIGKESDRLIEMIEQVLEFAGAQSGRQKLELQPVSISELIENVLAAAQPLLGEGGFQVEKTVVTDLPPVLADSAALSRALRNLLDNAMKYSGDSRWLGVQAKLSGSGRKPEIQISISDRGIGIPAEEQKYIFDPFWRGSEATTAQIHGNGLGLNLVKNIVLAHGGQISVQSQPGQGSTFTVSLPALAQTETHPAAMHSTLDAGTAD